VRLVAMKTLSQKVQDIVFNELAWKYHEEISTALMVWSLAPFY
jgi:hypothetical protein